jgi:PST family polysaccharide transporter
MASTAATATAEKHTYSQILKSSALIGGSSVVNILTRIIRTKAGGVAGPADRIVGVCGSIADLAEHAHGRNSGVRQIARPSVL